MAVYSQRREFARKGLPLLTTDEGYFIKSLDPDGVRHGVFGAAQHGYFEASPNHDAIAFRVVDQAQAERIYDKIASIPGLRPYAFTIPNFPSLDDMYEKPEGLWRFGKWVERRGVVHLRGAYNSGLLPAGPIRRRAPVHAATAHLRAAVSHG